jgi:hypothetical protein
MNQGVANIGGFQIDVPFIMLAAMVFLFGYIVWRANLGPRWAEAFQDDSGKVSLMRVMVILVGMSTVWIVMSVAIRVQPDLDTLIKLFGAMLIAWVPAKIIERVVDIVAVKFGIKKTEVS